MAYPNTAGRVAGLAVLVAVLGPPRLAAADSPGDRSPTVASALSIVGVAVPSGLVALGLLRDRPGLLVGGALAFLATPAAGHWYAGRLVTTGLGLRGIGVGVTLVGSLLALAAAFDCFDCGDDCCCR